MISLLLTVTISWIPPEYRVNGDHITAEEIGGYEIRKICEGITDHTILGPELTEYRFDDKYSPCEFSVAVFDNNGIHSDYVVAVESDIKIKAPTRGGIR